MSEVIFPTFLPFRKIIFKWNKVLDGKYIEITFAEEREKAESVLE